jgi:hypothetical protein
MIHQGVGNFGIRYYVDPDGKWYTDWFVDKKDRDYNYKIYRYNGKKVFIQKVDR